MSTRATIMVEGVDFVKVYKHLDGYPEGMDWLKEFNHFFKENRGDDPDYKIAQVLRWTGRKDQELGIDDSLTTGYGLVPYDADCWEDYNYELLKDGRVEVTALSNNQTFIME